MKGFLIKFLFVLDRIYFECRSYCVDAVRKCRYRGGKSGFCENALGGFVY